MAHFADGIYKLVSCALVAATALGAIPSHANNGSGPTVLCPESVRHSPRAMPLSQLEGELHYDLVYNSTERDLERILRTAAATLKFNPIFYSNMVHSLNTILRRLEYLPGGVEVTVPSDLQGGAPVPKGCRIGTFGFFKDKKFFVARDIVDRMTPQQFAMSIAQEALYAVQYYYGVPNTAVARRVIAQMFASNHSPKLLRELAAPWSPLRLETWNQSDLKPKSPKMKGSGKVWAFWRNQNISLRYTRFDDKKKPLASKKPEVFRCINHLDSNNAVVAEIPLELKAAPGGKWTFTIPKDCLMLNLGGQFQKTEKEAQIELFDGNELLISHTLKKPSLLSYRSNEPIAWFTVGLVDIVNDFKMERR